MDMVTEKNSDVEHDFFNDPLRLKSDGGWLKVSLQVAVASEPCLAFICRFSTILLGAWRPGCCVMGKFTCFPLMAGGQGHLHRRSAALLPRPLPEEVCQTRGASV